MDHVLRLVPQARNYLSFGVASIGVALEHLDVMLVNLYATSMATHFVSVSSQEQTVVLGFVGYGISFLFRPLGAVFFGLMSDRFGRRISMVVSVFLMSLATLGLGLIPDYETIGGLATLFFVLCRICQGICVGGEFGSATTYAYELSGKNRTTAGALVISATHTGGLVAAILATFHPDQFQFVFQMVGVFGVVSIFLRSLMRESRSEEIQILKVQEILSSNLANKAAYFRIFLVASALVFTYYSSIIYLNEIIFQRGLASRKEIFLMNCFLLGMWIVVPPCIAFVVDKKEVDYLRMMRMGAVSVAVLSGPVLFLVSRQMTFNKMVIAQFVIGFLHILYCFGVPRYLGDQFNDSIRATGVSLSYSLGASFVGAVTPLICHGLVSYFDRLEAIGVPIFVISLLAAMQLRSSRSAYDLGRRTNVVVEVGI